MSDSSGWKVVKGTKYQKRPSASYFYNELNVPVGYIVEYRPRKGGKMIKHSLRLRANGTPYWKPEEKLPLKSKKKSKSRTKKSRVKRTSKRASKKRTSKKRTSKRTSKRTKRRTKVQSGG